MHAQLEQKEEQKCGFVMTKGKVRSNLPLVSGAVHIYGMSPKSPLVLYKTAQYAIV